MHLNLLLLLRFRGMEQNIEPITIAEITQFCSSNAAFLGGFSFGLTSALGRIVTVNHT